MTTSLTPYTSQCIIFTIWYNMSQYWCLHLGQKRPPTRIWSSFRLRALSLMGIIYHLHGVVFRTQTATLWISWEKLTCLTIHPGQDYGWGTILVSMGFYLRTWMSSRYAGSLVPKGHLVCISESRKKMEHLIHWEDLATWMSRIKDVLS